MENRLGCIVIFLLACLLLFAYDLVANSHAVLPRMEYLWAET